MKKTIKIIITIISIIAILIVSFVFASKLNIKKDNEIVEENEFDELKNNVDNGHNGNVIDVIEGKDENNNRTYEYVFNNGESKIITIRKTTENDTTNVISGDELDFDSDDIDDRNKPSDYGTVYEKFMHMSSDDQTKFYESFDDPKDFYKWFEAAEAEYNKLHPKIVVDVDEVVDFGN